MHWTLPLSPSRSARLAITGRAVAEDHAVRPVLLVLVELGAASGSSNAVEIGEEVGRVSYASRSRGATLQVVDDRLGVDLLLDVERRRLHDEVGPVLPVLAAPDELRVANLDLAGLGELPALLLCQA